MGVRLFTRTTRSTRLTEAGEVLARRIGPILSEARAAMDEAMSSESTGRGNVRHPATDDREVPYHPPRPAGLRQSLPAAS